MKISKILLGLVFPIWHLALPHAIASREPIELDPSLTEAAATDSHAGPERGTALADDCAMPDKLKSDGPQSSQVARYEFIDNGIIRLGIDIESGGSVFCFAESATKRNVLNHFDRGRFVQQSFYGNSDGTVWDWAGGNAQKWVWNPVQGGNYSGIPAKIIEQKLDGNSVYVKTKPKHWVTGDDINDATMEQWITLDDEIAHIQYRFVYDGSEIHRITDQEMPAVFVDYALNELVSYRGDAPWTNAPLSRSNPGWPNEYHSASEEWSAYVDANDWGVGVYTPGTDKVTAYRYEGDGKYGPLAEATSYFAPIRRFSIKPGVTIDYNVYLTIGTVAEIRSRFADLANTAER
ncbi:hypothetical protein [Altererythrobacter sp. GH1-8]|uniref:hypothetical protein n=1 Tax=Altererythrobacter sp. GH1-8 TaxID=3349333 RepID=UPI00374CE10E